MKLIMVLLLVAVSLAGENIGPLPCTETNTSLQYDDGTAQWLTWVGTYRGTWFNPTDFYPDAGDYAIHSTEFWFYHSSSYPWDMSTFEAEVWDNIGLDTCLSSVSCIASHYTPIVVSYPEPLSGYGSFWVILDSYMSSGGWPSILSDGSGRETAHSFFSDDFDLWYPWEISSQGYCDYHIRAEADIGDVALQISTWGSIKGLHR